MIIKADDSYRLASAITYGVCLSLLYLGSTLYHSIPQPKIKAVLQKVDHCMIYLLIAGSYTPFTLIPLKGEWGWSLFGVSWGLAFLGIIQELTIGRKSEKRLLSMIIYVVMGWLILVALFPLVQSLSAAPGQLPGQSRLGPAPGGAAGHHGARHLRPLSGWQDRCCGRAEGPAGP